MESIYMPKVITKDLLQFICNHKSDPTQHKVKPDYLQPFLSFASNGMQEY